MRTSCVGVVGLLLMCTVIVASSQSSLLGSYRVADDVVSTIPTYTGEFSSYNVYKLRESVCDYYYYTGCGHN